MNNEYGITFYFGDLKAEFMVCAPSISKAMEIIYTWMCVVSPDALPQFMKSFKNIPPRLSSYEACVSRGPGIIKIYGSPNFCYFNEPWYQDELIEIPTELREWKDAHFNVS